MSFSRALALPKAILGLSYLAAYVLLDWISFIEPFAPFGITPWNPSTGLSFVVVLLFGQRFVPLLFVAPLLADVAVRHFPLPWMIEVVTVTVIGGGYAVALMILMRPRIQFDPALSLMRDLLLLMLAAVIAAAFVAITYVGAVIGAGLLPVEDFLPAALRYWIGDVIGIVVVTPFTLIISTRARALKPSFETAAQFGAIVAALALVFGHAGKHHFQLFYVLFLPIVWMAVRTGIEGVSIGILVTQLGLIAGVHLLPKEELDVTAFQALMLVLATTGLVAGTLVTERRRTESQLRLHQDSLARLARIGGMGEFATKLAHEINQPLMAAGTYTRLVNEALHAGNVDATATAETAQKAATQVERAAEVLRRLRALIRLDRSGRAPCGVGNLIKETVVLCQPDLDRSHVGVRPNVPHDIPPVMVDMLQAEQVLLNLMRNSIEAISGAGHVSGTIFIEVSRADADFVEFRVRDTGPGFAPEILKNPFLPFSSTKAEGLGIGLSLCRSIVESHGGRFWLNGNSQGAVVHFTVPVASPSHV